jgi:hypothetical protein
MATMEERFWAKVDKTDTCWLWTGYTCKGYGQFCGRPGTRAAHRITYEILVGPIPQGMDLDHLCRVRACCNPAHLEPVTRRENLVRGETLIARQVALIHCPQGHPYDEANTFITSAGRRHCRACDRDRHRQRRAVA